MKAESLLDKNAIYVSHSKVGTNPSVFTQKCLYVFIVIVIGYVLNKVAALWQLRQVSQLSGGWKGLSATVIVLSREQKMLWQSLQDYLAVRARLFARFWNAMKVLR